MTDEEFAAKRRELLSCSEKRTDHKRRQRGQVVISSEAEITVDDRPVWVELPVMLKVMTGSPVASRKAFEDAAVSRNRDKLSPLAAAGAVLWGGPLFVADVVAADFRQLDLE